MILAIFLTAVLVLAYVFLLRPILVHAPVLSAAYAAEASWFEKLRVKLAGWKTTLVARFFMLASAAVEFYDFVLPLLMGQDWSSVTSQLPGWVTPAVMFFQAVVFAWLRRVTENPPQVITQRMPDGSVQVVGVNKV